MFSFKSYFWRHTNASGSVDDLMSILNRRKIRICWVVEAGCFDGSDTFIFAKLPSVKHIFAFEPDRMAYAKALKKLTLDMNKVSLYSEGLHSKKGYAGIMFHEGIPASGSSTLAEFESSDEIVKVVRLDEILSPPDDRGLLWLDVEGSAFDALLGSLGIISKFAVIKVEVEFENLSPFRQKNSSEVIDLLKKNGFILIRIDMQPSKFGDCLFVRKSEVGVGLRIRGYILLNLQITLRRLVFPIFNVLRNKS